MHAHALTAEFQAKKVRNLEQDYQQELDHLWQEFDKERYVRTSW